MRTRSVPPKTLGAVGVDKLQSSPAKMKTKELWAEQEGNLRHTGGLPAQPRTSSSRAVAGSTHWLAQSSADPPCWANKGTARLQRCSWKTVETSSLANKVLTVYKKNQWLLAQHIRGVLGSTQITITGRASEQGVSQPPVSFLGWIHDFFTFTNIQ